MTENLLCVLKAMSPGIFNRFYQVVVMIYSDKSLTQSELKNIFHWLFLLPTLRHLESNSRGTSPDRKLRVTSLKKKKNHSIISNVLSLSLMPGGTRAWLSPGKQVDVPLKGWIPWKSLPTLQPAEVSVQGGFKQGWGFQRCHPCLSESNQEKYAVASERLPLILIILPISN